MRTTPATATHRRSRAALPLWLAVLALCVRLLLPLGHDHAAHSKVSHEDGHGCCHAVVVAKPTCACGGHELPAAPQHAVDESHTHAPCWACDFEHGTPGAAPLRTVHVPGTRSSRAPPLAAARRELPDGRPDHHRARAPPFAPPACS